MRKLFYVTVLVMVLIFLKNFAQAKDVYVGVYPAGGLNAYLLTETVNITGRNPIGPVFNCTIRAGSSYYIDYKFFVIGSMVNGVDSRRTCYKNSDGYSGYVFDGNSPVEAQVYRYVRNNWR